jgi:hypothetical protein
MHRPIFFFVTGLTCGLFVATGGVHLSASRGAEHGPSTALALQTDIVPAQDPAPESKPEETDRQRLERKVRKLLEDNGTKAMQKRSMEGMLGQFEKAGLPPEFGTKFMARFDLDHVMELAIKVYADHLDEATVDALAGFYATPSGKKLADATPDITVEITQAGMEYGQKIGAEVYEEMSK